MTLMAHSAHPHAHDMKCKDSPSAVTAPHSHGQLAAGLNCQAVCAGRAGRDGLPAQCLLYYRPADVMRQAALVVTEPGWQSHLFGMMDYAEHTCGCRRATISRPVPTLATRCL